MGTRLDQLRHMLAAGSPDEEFKKGINIVSEEAKKHINAYSYDGQNIHQAIDSVIIDVAVSVLTSLINE